MSGAPAGAGAAPAPGRIVSLEPSVTATLVALGERRRLVAVTRHCGRLVDVAGLPELESTWSVSADAVAALDPDLVIAAAPYRAGKVDELLRSGLDVLCLYPRSLADVEAHVGWLGRLCDAAAPAAEVVAGMRAIVADLQRRAAGRPRRRVYVEGWPEPLMNAAPWVAELVERLGGEFVPQPPGRRIAEAEVIEADPEVIVVNWAGVERLDPARVRRRAGWEQVSAVRSGRVVAVNEILLNAPGPNLADGARELWRALHGEPGDDSRWSPA